MHSPLKAFSAFLTQTNAFLPPSAKVDILLFLIGLKSCCRTCLSDKPESLSQVRAWAEKHNIECESFNPAGFIYFARTQELLKELMRLDLSDEPHAAELGRLLSYPPCCSDKMAHVGELYIDAFEEELLRNPFDPNFRLINTHKYGKGVAFISHVPCSTNCLPSLEQALKVREFVLANREVEILKPWVEEQKQLEEVSLFNQNECIPSSTGGLFGAL